MKKNPILPIVIIVLIALGAISGCTESSDRHNNGFDETLKEESRQIAEEYVKSFDSYKTYNLTEPILLETRSLNCSSCWQFIYKFDLVSEKDLSVVDTARVTVTVTDGEVIEAVYIQGSKY